MKSTIFNGLLMLALSCATVASAALYKGYDSKGTVIFSDRPFEDAKKFKLPPISVVGGSKDKTEEVSEEVKPVEFKYMGFDIVSPTENQAIRYDSDVTVSLQVKPGINTEKGHSIWMLVDGKPLVENTQSLTLQLGRLALGGHRLQAQIRDGEGNIAVRTRTATVFIYRKTLP